MIEVPTYQATIHCGLREDYDGQVHNLDEVRSICQQYVDSIGLCVSVTQTEFIYNGGREPGVSIGLINYPRFPSDVETIQERAIMLALKLKHAFRQNRVSIVCTDKTFMLGDTA